MRETFVRQSAFLPSPNLVSEGSRGMLISKYSLRVTGCVATCSSACLQGRPSELRLSRAEGILPEPRCLLPAFYALQISGCDDRSVAVWDTSAVEQHTDARTGLYLQPMYYLPGPKVPTVPSSTDSTTLSITSFNRMQLPILASLLRIDWQLECREVRMLPFLAFLYSPDSSGDFSAQGAVV